MPGAFVINTTNDRTLMVTPEKGDRGVLIFTSQKKASAYIGEHRIEPMHPLELTPLTVNLWIAKMRRNGAQVALIDPPAAGDIGDARRGSLDDIREIVSGDGSESEKTT